MKPYKFPEQLTFGHLKHGDLFTFVGDDKNKIYQKLSTFLHVEVNANLIGHKIVSKIKPNASAKRAKSLSLPVTDSILNLIFN